jgi:hypothetical protein
MPTALAWNPGQAHNKVRPIPSNSKSTYCGKGRKSKILY